MITKKGQPTNTRLYDITKLKTYENYGAMIGKSRQDVYYLVKSKKINGVSVDGKLFVDTSV